MNKSKSVLLYNLYPLFNWESITDHLLTNVPHDDIIVHISIPKRNPAKAIEAYRYLKKNKKIKNIYLSLNFKSKGESSGFDIFRKKIDFNNYSIASYIHSKGSSRKRKNKQPIKDWTALLKYYVVDRLDLAQQAFKNGYYLYGVNLSRDNKYDPDGNGMFPESKFHYSGNFVTFNLRELKTEFLKAQCKSHYYGVEFFWGTLCNIDKAYNIHQSNVDHYQDVDPESNYK